MWGCGFYHFQGWECRASALREHFGDELTWFGISAVGSSIFVGKATGHGVCCHHHVFNLNQNYFPLNHPRIGLMEHVLDPLWIHNINSRPISQSVNSWGWLLGVIPELAQRLKMVQGEPGWGDAREATNPQALKNQPADRTKMPCVEQVFFFLNSRIGQSPIGIIFSGISFILIISWQPPARASACAVSGSGVVRTAVFSAKGRAPVTSFFFGETMIFKAIKGGFVFCMKIMKGLLFNLTPVYCWDRHCFHHIWLRKLKHIFHIKIISNE